MVSNPLGKKGLRPFMLRTVADQPTLWEAILPEELRRLPVELARVDALLDDPAFFTPFVPFFDLRIGRPSTAMETYLRLMFLKFRYRLGDESLCREVSDSITWRQFCRIGLDQPVPHPTTLMKLTTRCGSVAVNGLNEALLVRVLYLAVFHGSCDLSRRGDGGRCSGDGTTPQRGAGLIPAPRCVGDRQAQPKLRLTVSGVVFTRDWLLSGCALLPDPT